jgi:hypothetical protein
MPSLQDKLVNNLAIAPVRLQQSGTTVNQDLRSCIDVGASNCFTRPGILKPLGFQSNGTWLPPGSSSPYPSFDVEIGISKAGQDVKWFPVKLMEHPHFPFTALGCELAIGQDFLKNCRFTYDGPKSEFILEW